MSTQYPVVQTLSFVSGTPLENGHAVSTEHVKQIIVKTPKKPRGVDLIPSPLFFDCLDKLIPVITNIINTSMTSGVAPYCSMHTFVKPLTRKPNLDCEFLKNYRPVSNLPSLSKVLERVFLAQLTTTLRLTTSLSRCSRPTGSVIVRKQLYCVW